MNTFFWSIVSFICLKILSLRYKVELKGEENIHPKNLKREGGILFLPNHPALIDPLFLVLLLWPRYKMRPLVVEYMYRTPILHTLLRLGRSVPVPNFETSVNLYKVRKAEQAMQTVLKGLQKGENFAIYPAGRLKRGAREVLGGASATHALLEKCPEANIILVRTTGLWGSSFSHAFSGGSLDMKKLLLHGIKSVLKNLIFFTPRRKIVLEVEPEPADFPRGKSRVEFNRYLETWYNRYSIEGRILDEEPLQLVPYTFWQKGVFADDLPKKEMRQLPPLHIPDKTTEKVYGQIRRILSDPALEIRPEMHLANDLGMDSLNISELTFFLSQHYQVRNLSPDELETVQSALEIAEGRRSFATEQRLASLMSSFHWPKESHRPLPLIPRGKTMPEAFLNAAERMDSAVACGDDFVGPLSYHKMKQGVLVLAEHFKTFPETHVAILLPASVGVYTVILALQMAGKVPVMLNWTLGPKFLEDMMQKGEAARVLSSWRFLERLSYVDLGSLSDQVELLEDIRSKITLGQKLRGAFLSLCPRAWVVKRWRLDQISDEERAVILFTSGSEGSPKGVPLTHKNILSSLRGAMQGVEWRSTDVLYGVLPPFHSFGFSVAGFATLFAGVKTAFYPDPTDTAALLRGIQRWNVTILCSPPTFMKNLFQMAKPGELAKMRYFISGAEKTPRELLDAIHGVGAASVEGYGITECSPTLSATRVNLPQPKGVGYLIPDTYGRTVHPETKEPLAPGAEGEICVKGPGVFKGYIGKPRQTFVEIDGENWYLTGDLGHFEPDGELVLSGRLKRFTKLGGEMISLGAVEETLIAALANRETKGTFLAVIADERELGRAQLVLFTTLSLTKEEANEILKKSGFSRLVKISALHHVDFIPLLGTGKVDYRKLQASHESP